VSKAESVIRKAILRLSGMTVTQEEIPGVWTALAQLEEAVAALCPPRPTPPLTVLELYRIGRINAETCLKALRVPAGSGENVCHRCGEPDPCGCEPQIQGKSW